MEKIKANESYQVQKARKKLQKQLEQEKRLINQKTIEQMKRAIQIWIERHQSERVELKDRPIKLFDENQHSAKTKSRYVREMLNRIKGTPKEKSTSQPLVGRIKSS